MRHDSRNVDSSDAVHMTVIRQERTRRTEMSSVVDETLKARCGIPETCRQRVPLRGCSSREQTIAKCGATCRRNDQCPAVRGPEAMSISTVIYILKSEAPVCATVCRYFLAPCDKRKHTGHAKQQAASHASTDSAWRHPVWLPHSSLGFQRPVGRRGYHNKPRLRGTVRDATSHNRAKRDCVVIIIQYLYSILKSCKGHRGAGSFKLRVF